MEFLFMLKAFRELYVNEGDKNQTTPPKNTICTHRLLVTIHVHSTTTHTSLTFYLNSLWKREIHFENHGNWDRNCHLVSSV